MARPENAFRTLGGGVPVHYDRRSEADYGTRGIATSFNATTNFETKLDRCFEQLWATCPLGRAEVITSAGAYVNKPGFHGLGRAFDLDGIFWRGKDFVTLRAGFEGRDRRFYLAVEAILRIHFGEVLNYSFNAEHRDHFHISDVEPRFSRNTRSGTFFLQNALTFVLGRSVGRDGRFGTETEGALRGAMTDLGVSGDINNLTVWQQFLRGVAQRGFQDVQELSEGVAESRSTAAGEGTLSAEPTPDELLRNIYEVIDQELGCTSLKPRIEGAVTAFANHPEVQAILEPSQPDDQSVLEPADEQTEDMP